MSEILEPISLGYSCDVKYQVSRNLFFRRRPQASEGEFRDMLFRSQGQPSIFRRHIFDWMIAPLAAVCAYLESDFRGVFERHDLELAKDDTVVRHRTLLTYHPHDFQPGAGGKLTEAMVDAQYAAFRGKYEHLAQRFRELLITPGPYLYVYKEVIKLADAQRLANLLQARSPDHRFEMLFVGYEGGVNQVLSRLSVPAQKAWLPPGCVKEEARQWEGDDAPWDLILDRFSLGLDGLDPAAAPAPPPQVGSLRARSPGGRPPSAGWRSLIDAQTPDDLFAVFSHVDANPDDRRYVWDDERTWFQDPYADDHFFCQFLPVALSDLGGWARLTLDWARGDAPRAVVGLQDQDCRHPTAYAVAEDKAGGGLRQILTLPLAADVDHLRLVITPGGGQVSDLPRRLRLEVNETAPRPLIGRLLEAVGLRP